MALMADGMEPVSLFEKSLLQTERNRKTRINTVVLLFLVMTVTYKLHSCTIEKHDTILCAPVAFTKTATAWGAHGPLGAGARNANSHEGKRCNLQPLQCRQGAVSGNDIQQMTYSKPETHSFVNAFSFMSSAGKLPVTLVNFKHL